jgi:hypothetical protein
VPHQQGLDKRPVPTVDVVTLSVASTRECTGLQLQSQPLAGWVKRLAQNRCFVLVAIDKYQYVICLCTLTAHVAPFVDKSKMSAHHMPMSHETPLNIAFLLPPGLRPWTQLGVTVRQTPCLLTPKSVRLVTPLDVVTSQTDSHSVFIFVRRKILMCI